MKNKLFVLHLGIIFGLFVSMVNAETAKSRRHHDRRNLGKDINVQLGPRPFYLVDKMEDSKLKKELEDCACSDDPYGPSDFSIGHRGAPLMFPEHTKESYEAAAIMGAGILECDVTFTSDAELVCRHAQCDLHTTTNILAIPELAAKCSEPFTPAIIDPDTGELLEPASAKCCASDITLEEFKTLCGKMDASNPRARSVEEYLGGTANWRTDLYSTCGTVLSHKESIELFKSLGAKMTPELKSPEVEMPFDTDGDGVGDFSQEDYAQKMIDEYREAHVRPKNVYAQSFNLDDVLYWVANEPKFGKQAVFLDGRYDQIDPADPSAKGLVPSMKKIAEAGVNIIAPPMWVLLRVNAKGNVKPSKYAKSAKRHGLDIITWTTERSGRIVEEVLEGRGSAFYYLSTLDALTNDGNILTNIDVLAKKVGVLGIFSDWPATTTFYANCMGLK